MIDGFYKYANEFTDPPNKECVQYYKAKGETWKCLFAQYSLKFIDPEIKILVIQSGYDFVMANRISKIYCYGFSSDCADYGHDRKRLGYYKMNNCSEDEMEGLEKFRARIYAALKKLK